MAAARLGLPVPSNDAAVLVTVETSSVVTVGAAVVVKERTAPKPVPEALEAMAQK